MGIEFFGLTLFKPKPNLQMDKVITKSPKLEALHSPKTKELLRKNKSEENFVKFQVPWIL